eukprot:CAMPEP_0184699552 /NCGR_PEP_ID=MMETSP0313-20130426/5797_1 /TAXON_ID=2792 /ORGANISM="Porphyridium aerugineum, Strain SAG 1380-2" /LENGTH=53 /DNA_ID=CAMNT_0027158671 /DNA_START=26 /DNA_END=187 /DNA_ORIENTATION=-
MGPQFSKSGDTRREGLVTNDSFDARCAADALRPICVDLFEARSSALLDRNDVG